MSETPLPPAPPTDDKDWTWVLQQACPDCGFDGPSVPPTEVAETLRANVEEWVQLLRDGAPELRLRPTPTTWSASEYAAHVRDVLAIMDRRLERMLTEDEPRFANWDQDATAVEERYDLQTAEDIVGDLQDNGARLTDRLSHVDGPQWGRSGHRSDGASFTVGTFALYLLHDPVHHLHDVAVGIEQLTRDQPTAPGLSQP